MKETVADCIIVGAGPGGLQAGIHLGRYNFSVLLFDRSGGRTRHAVLIENFLGHRSVSGRTLIETGVAQLKEFGVHFVASAVERIRKRGPHFEVFAEGRRYRSRFVIAASGGSENYPRLGNIGRFFGRRYFTCLVCDGYRTTGRKLLVIDNSLYGVRLSIGMKERFTRDTALLIEDMTLPPDHAALLAEEGIPLLEGKAVELLGETDLEGVRLADGRIVECEVIMGGHGFSLNDGYLAELSPKRDGDGFKILAKPGGESSVPGLFVVGALRPGHSQAVIAAGQGAEAAIEISHRLIEI